MRFVLIDESLMRSGYWVNIDGVDLKQFEKNPIMYFMHIRPGDSYNANKENMLHAIGTWKDIKVENIAGLKAITAEAVFDEKDDFAMTIKQKCESGVYKMASAGLQKMEWSQDPVFLKPGQTYETLTKSIMLEASIVDRGANDNAIKLFDDSNNEIKLSDLQTINRKKIMQEENLKLKDVASILVLGAGATAELALKAISDLKNENADLNAKIIVLKQQEADLDAKLKEFAEAQKQAFYQKLESAELKLSDANKAIYKEMYEKDTTLAEKALALAPKYAKLSDVPGTQKAEDKYNDLTFSELSKKHPKYLAELKLNDQTKFNELYKAEYGKDYKF